MYVTAASPAVQSSFLRYFFDISAFYRPAGLIFLLLVFVVLRDVDCLGVSSL